MVRNVELYSFFEKYEVLQKMTNYLPSSSVNIGELRSYIEEIVSIPKKCWDDFSSIIELKSFKKDEAIIQQGARYNNEVFIIDGIIRAYFVDEQGNDRNTAFYESNAFMSTNTLRSKDGLSIYYYQALTDTNILEFNSKLFLDLLKKYPNLLKVAKSTKEQEIDRLNKREKCIMQVITKFRHCLIRASPVNV